MPINSAIQQSLSSLLPAHASKIPAQLAHLSESLLAQSRQRASHLKPEEEIARAYACCEIACKRLRAQCRLPAVKTGGAPCKPAVYKKLVTFLGRVLDGDVAGTPKSASKKRTADGSLKSIAEPPSEPTTPSRKTPRSTFVGKVKASSGATRELDSELEAPSYTMPSIRRLCKAFSTPLLAPHVYTGTCVVLRLAGLWPRADEDGQDEQRNTTISHESSFDEAVIGLLIALYLMTLTKMQVGKMTATGYTTTCDKAVELLGYKPGEAGVEKWIRTINRDQYCRGQDWWTSVPDSVFEYDSNRALLGVVGEEAVAEDEDDRILTWPKGQLASRGNGRGSEAAEDPEGVLLPGLATMMQDAFDLLSDERQHEFERWRKDILKRLAKLDKAPRSSAGKAVTVK